jgi:hypothetical protein
MLRLLLDEHLSPQLSRQLSSRLPEAFISSMQSWEAGKYLGLPDEVILAAAREEGWTLVTFDQRTIAPLIKSWAEQGITHGGVVFIDQRTFAPNDLGGLLRALEALWNAQATFDWTNRVVYLTR